MSEADELAGKRCAPCEGGVQPMSEGEIRTMLGRAPGWAYENGEIARTFTFRDYYQTMAFANALAWIAHREDHHPDMEIGYKTCRVRYSTHAIGGISENDFICATKINALAGP